MDPERKRTIEKIKMEQRIHHEARKFGVRGLARHMFAIIFTLVGLMIALASPDIAEDYFRIFTLSMGAYIMVFTARIVQVNFRIARHTEGLLAPMPLHIRAIGTSYIIQTFSLHAWVVSRFGVDNFFWYGLPMIIISDIVGIFALGVVWRFQEVKRKAAGL